MTHPGELLKQAGLYAGKELGQNFLSSPPTAQMIVDRAGVTKDTVVLEVGPGLGALTVPLARAAGRVVAVEKDRRMIPLLMSELALADLDNVQVLNQDILKTDIMGISEGRKLTVLGNLPYNISSQILFQLVKVRSVVDKAFLMFQKELAQRLLAPPGGRDYSRLSAVVQYAAKISHVATIGPSSFFPKPEVDSTVLGFAFIHDQGLDPAAEDLLFGVIKAAFSMRRKTLKNSMTGGDLGLSKTQVDQALELAGVDPVRRAETLDLEAFLAITQAVRQILQE